MKRSKSRIIGVFYCVVGLVGALPGLYGLLIFGSSFRSSLFMKINIGPAVMCLALLCGFALLFSTILQTIGKLSTAASLFLWKKQRWFNALAALFLIALGFKKQMLPEEMQVVAGNIGVILWFVFLAVLAQLAVHWDSLELKAKNNHISGASLTEKFR